MNGWIEARHRCVYGSHTRTRSHEAFLPVDPQFDEAEASDTGDEPPTIFHLIVLEYDEVLLWCHCHMVMDEQVKQDR